jgi:hypothetical protein
MLKKIRNARESFWGIEQRALLARAHLAEVPGGSRWLQEAPGWCLLEPYGALMEPCVAFWSLMEFFGPLSIVARTEYRAHSVIIFTPSI